MASTVARARRGEMWVWYTLWLAPILLVWSAFFNVSFVGDVNQALEWIPVTFVTLLGLLLPYSARR